MGGEKGEYTYPVVTVGHTLKNTLTIIYGDFAPIGFKND